ncbi:hypothetical protein [Absidia glauca]|uniref:Nucleotide-diphospho-sugar transferase domain-containing protein n=1 Tax=Absidia glauca TaxID=4829 RepID=A0A168L8P3_ABSGL|nr:hypothetical protein [Absidia glauca]
MINLRYAAILIVTLVSLLTLRHLNQQEIVTSYSPSLAFEASSNDLLNNSNSDTNLYDNSNNTTALSTLARSPWLCDCFYYGSSIPQLLRDTPVPTPDPIEDGDLLPLIEPATMTLPDEQIMAIINSNLHWPKTLILTVANHGMRHHVYNWIRSLERTHEERYVVVCLDQALYDHLYKAGYGNHAFVIPPSWSHYAISSELANYPSNDYRLITFTKSVVVQHILHLDISAFYSDVDVVWTRTRTRDYVRGLMDLRGGNTHVLFQQDDVQQHNVNSGFFLMRPTPIMKRFIADTIYIQEQREQELWESTNGHQPDTAAMALSTQQVAMNEALQRMNLEIRTTHVVLLDAFFLRPAISIPTPTLTRRNPIQIPSFQFAPARCLCAKNAADRTPWTEPICVCIAGTQIEMKIEPPRQAQEWSYFSHRESIGKASSSLGIRSNKSTHINGDSSARMSGNGCANVDQIRRQGRWNNTTINGAYLTNLPRELVRSMAGSSTYGRFFYIARAALNPPTSLCKKLFPAIGEWHDRLAAKELSHGDPIQPTVAENAFVQVIMMFRKTFIQDSVLMMKLHPCHPIWQHSIFSDPAYLSFKR